MVDGRPRIADEPPFLFHPPQTDPFEADFRAAFEAYKAQLPDHLRFLLRRFDVVDVAMKVAGVGSVGMRCGIVLLMAGDEDPAYPADQGGRPFRAGAIRGQEPV